MNTGQLNLENKKTIKLFILRINFRLFNLQSSNLEYSNIKDSIKKVIT